MTDCVISLSCELVSGWTQAAILTNARQPQDKMLPKTLFHFDRANTLSEFNSVRPALVFSNGLWSSYLPKESIMAQNGRVIATHTWESVGELWHPGLKNVASPWDRSYGIDVNLYLSPGLCIYGLLLAKKVAR